VAVAAGVVLLTVADKAFTQGSPVLLRVA
jgi:hypothetical protein